MPDIVLGTRHTTMSKRPRNKNKISFLLVLYEMFYDRAKIELLSQFLGKIKEISGVSDMFLLLLSLLYSEEKCGNFYTHENK